MHLEYVKKAAKCRLNLHCFPLIAIMMTSFSNYIVDKYEVYFVTFAFLWLFKDRAAVHSVCFKKLNILSACRELFCSMLQCDICCLQKIFLNLVENISLLFHYTKSNSEIVPLFLPQFVAVYRGWREIEIRYSWEILFTDFHGHYARVTLYRCSLCRVLNILTFDQISHFHAIACRQLQDLHNTQNSFRCSQNPAPDLPC